MSKGLFLSKGMPLNAQAGEGWTLLESLAQTISSFSKSSATRFPEIFSRNLGPLVCRVTRSHEVCRHRPPVPPDGAEGLAVNLPSFGWQEGLWYDGWLAVWQDGHLIGGIPPGAPSILKIPLNSLMVGHQGHDLALSSWNLLESYKWAVALKMSCRPRDPAISVIYAAIKSGDWHEACALAVLRQAFPLAEIFVQMNDPSPQWKRFLENLGAARFKQSSLEGISILVADLLPAMTHEEALQLGRDLNQMTPLLPWAEFQAPVEEA